MSVAKIKPKIEPSVGDRRPDDKDAGEEATRGKSENTRHWVVIGQDDDPEFDRNRSEQGNQREDGA